MAMYLYGASGHAKVIMDILKANDVRVTSLVDDNKDISSLCGVSVLHEVEGNMSPMIISIGNNHVRKKIANMYLLDYASTVHPSAIVSDSVHIGCGTVVMPMAIVQVDSKVGEHCIINTGAIVEHDCEIGDFAHIAPGSTLCGNVAVSEGAWVGAGATIIQGIKIGKWATIGAGAVVVKDVPDYAVVAGVPAKILRYKEHE